MRRDIWVYIEDILESISKIGEYTKELSEGEFYENTQIQDAVLRRNEGYSYSRILWGKFRANLEAC